MLWLLAAAPGGAAFPAITDAERALTAVPGHPGAPAVVLSKRAELRLADPAGSFHQWLWDPIDPRDGIYMPRAAELLWEERSDAQQTFPAPGGEPDRLRPLVREGWPAGRERPGRGPGPADRASAPAGRRAAGGKPSRSAPDR